MWYFLRCLSNQYFEIGFRRTFVSIIAEDLYILYQPNCAVIAKGINRIISACFLSSILLIPNAMLQAIPGVKTLCNRGRLSCRGKRNVFHCYFIITYSSNEGIPVVDTHANPFAPLHKKETKKSLLYFALVHSISFRSRNTYAMLMSDSLHKVYLIYRKLFGHVDIPMITLLFWTVKDLFLLSYMRLLSLLSRIKAIIWINAGILLIGTNFSEILIAILPRSQCVKVKLTFQKKMDLKVTIKVVYYQASTCSSNNVFIVCWSNIRI